MGAVLTFVPQIIMLFLFITFLESCGYMARVAVIMDRIFKKLGLSGKSFIPMIVGCGCSVPAILSTKTIENPIERRATIMLTPFIPCSAKLPVFALIAGVLFPNNPFIAPSMYFLGIFMVILGALFLKMFYKTEKSDIFVMELPHYRLPKATNVLKELWEKTRGFVVRAGIIIVPAVIVLWLLQGFNFKFQSVGIEQSMLAQIGKCIAWIFVPLGFGNWESAIAFLTGVVAKEAVVATYGVILAGRGDLTAIFTPLGAYAFMAFLLLSAPCIAAIAATKKELNSNKWLFITIAFQFFVAYVTALCIYNFKYFPILLVALVFIYCIRKIIRRRGCGCGKCGNCTKCGKEIA
jgi:ferrous iron transport protein B